MTDQLLQLIATQAWQIAALAIVVAVVNRTFAKNRPHLAHALWMLVLIKCVTPPIWGHSLGLFSQLQAMWKTEPVVQQDLSSDEPLLMPPVDTDDEIALAPPADDPMLPGLIAMKDSEAASTPNVPITLPTKTADSSFVPEAKPWKPSWPMILLSLVASGALLTISIMVARCVLCLRHIHRHRTTEFDEPLNEQLQRLSRQLRLRRVPRIIVSDVLFGPAVIGLWRHVIVLPRCLIKAESRVEEQSRGASEPGSKGEIAALRSHSPEPARSLAPPLSTLDPILAHELLHIRRGDLRTGTLQAIVQSLWWFHPAVWLCNRWLSREAERCCDEQVIAELGCSPTQYARSLLSVIESKHALQPIPVFPGMKPVEITSQRMERIMSLKSNLKKQTPLWCWLAVAVLAVVVLPGAVATIEADELKNSQTGARASASTAPSSQEQPKDNFDHQQRPKQAENLIPHFVELFKVPVSLNLKDRSLFSIVEMLAEEHHFSRSWSIPSNEEHLFRSMDYSCHQLPLRTALEQIVEKAGCRLTIDQYTVEIQRSEVNPPSTMKSMDAQASERSPEWALKQIRWNDTLMVSPNQIPTGETVIAWVNDVPVRVSDVVSMERQTPGRFIIRALNERVGQYLAQEIVIQHSMLTAGDRFAVEMASNAEHEIRLNGAESESWLAQWAFSREAARVFYARERMMRHLHLVYDGMIPHIVQAAIDAARKRIFDAQLRTPVSYAVEGTDLANAVVMVGSEFAIDISVSPLHVEMATRTVNRPVTIDFRNRPLADLIRAIIEPYGMNTEIGPDRIQIALSKLAEERFYSATPPAYAVFGQVKNAGWTQLSSDVRFLEAIRNAGLDAERNVVDVTLSRMQTEDGRPKHRTMSLSQLEADASGELNCLLQDGDIITIQRDPNVRVADQSVKNASVAPAETSVATASKAVADSFEVNRLARVMLHDSLSNDVRSAASGPIAVHPPSSATKPMSSMLNLSPGFVAYQQNPSAKADENSFDSNQGDAEEPTATLRKSDGEPLKVVCYNVAELVTPIDGTAWNGDFSQVVELIKATVEPASWRDDLGKIKSDDNTLSLVICQTPQAHEQIAKLLSQLNDDLDQVAIRCRLMKLTSDQQLTGVEERCTLNVMNKHKQWALLTKERTEGIANFLTDEKCHVLLCPTITTFSGMMATLQVDPHESVEAQGNRWSRSLGFEQGSTTTPFHGCAIGVEPRIIGDSSVIRLKHSVYLNLNPQPENAAGPVTGNEGTSPLSVDESLVSSGQTLLLLIDTTKVNTKDAVFDPTSDPQNGARGKYVVMLTVERLEEEEVQVRQ